MDCKLFYTAVCEIHPPAEVTLFSRRWLTHTVHETKGVSPYDTMVGHPFFETMVDAHCARDEGGFTL